jgi:hypothetical protein
MNKKIDLTFSEILYLFADKTISERSKFVNYDNHPSGEKISVKPLAYKMVTSALAFLVENEYLSLSVKEVKKMVFLSGKEIFGKKIKERGPEVTGIEKKLLDNFKNETEVRKAVYYLLDDDSSSPAGSVIHISKNSLVEKGFLFIEAERKNIFSTKRYLYDEKKINELLPLYEEAENKLKEFIAKEDNYKLIENAVQKGINARQEQSSSDD